MVEYKRSTMYKKLKDIFFEKGKEVGRMEMLCELMDEVASDGIETSDKETGEHLLFMLKRLDAKAKPFKLEFCRNCFQMTNHLKGKCQKCTPEAKRVFKAIDRLNEKVLGKKKSKYCEFETSWGRVRFKRRKP